MATVVAKVAVVAMVAVQVAMGHLLLVPGTFSPAASELACLLAVQITLVLQAFNAISPRLISILVDLVFPVVRMLVKTHRLPVPRRAGKRLFAHLLPVLGDVLVVYMRLKK